VPGTREYVALVTALGPYALFARQPTEAEAAAGRLLKSQDANLSSSVAELCDSLPALDRNPDPNPDPSANPRPSQADLVSMLLREMVTGDGTARSGPPVLGSLFIPHEHLQAGHALFCISGFVRA